MFLNQPASHDTPPNIAFAVPYTNANTQKYKYENTNKQIQKYKNTSDVSKSTRIARHPT